jgi:hypothetical protein
VRVLFLDCDGVVNHHRWWRVREPYEPGGGLLARRIRDCDPASVSRLNTIVARTGCAVVLSSSWRHDENGLRVVEAALQARGATFSLLSATPDCARELPSGLYTTHGRGHEIQEWLNAHPMVTRFAIVDDDSDMGPLLPRRVRTTMERGLLDEHVEKLIALLEEP